MIPHGLLSMLLTSQLLKTTDDERIRDFNDGGRASLYDLGDLGERRKVQRTQHSPAQNPASVWTGLTPGSTKNAAQAPHQLFGMQERLQRAGPGVLSQ